MNAHPALTPTPNWGCGCTRLYCPTALDATCNACEQPFQALDERGRTKLIDAAARFPSKEETRVPRHKQGGHVTIPRALLYDTEITPAQFRIAACLYDHCAPGRLTARLSWSNIEERVGVSRGTVATAIDVLHDRRWIFDAVDRKGAKGRGHFYEYHLADVPNGPETTRKRKPRRKPYAHVPGAAPVAKPAPSVAKPAPPQTCPACYGSGWEPTPNGARRCACRAEGGSKN